MKPLLISFLITILPFVVTAQVKDDFQHKLAQERQKNIFTAQVLQLESLCRNGIDTAGFNLLKTTGNFDFVSFKTLKGSVTVVFDIIPLWAEAYMQLEREGKINSLKKLRAAGNLKLTSRVIANEVELPKKTNNRQSYNDFYQDIIKQLMTKYKVTLSNDQLDFATYQTWEKEEHLTTEAAIREFRESFILFLYNHYHLK